MAFSTRTTIFNQLKERLPLASQVVEASFSTRSDDRYGKLVLRHQILYESDMLYADMSKNKLASLLCYMSMESILIASAR